MAKKQHHTPVKHNILPTLREELNLLREIFEDSSLKWSSPIANLVPRVHDAVAAGDSYLRVAGGWSTDLGFWWHLEWPKEVVQRTLLYLKNNKQGKFISINILEYATVIINCAESLASYHARNSNIHPLPDALPI